MDNCLFCSIVAKKIPAEVLYEDATAIAFLDIHPRSLGHTVVTPKSHAEHILDLEDGLLGELFKGVKKTTALLKKALDPHGFTIGINHGKHAGQEIDHLHVHIMPRFMGDGGRAVQSVVQNPSQESIQEVAIRIKNNN